MKLIPVHAGKNKFVHAIVDDEDFEWLSPLTGWHLTSHGQIQLTKSRKTPKPRPNKKFSKYYTALMSRLITLPWAEELVLHRNGNSLDCRRENLEVVDFSEARRRTVGRSSKVRNAKNYSLQKKTYQIHIQRNGHKVYTTAKTEEDAQRKVKEILEQISTWEPHIGEAEIYYTLDDKIAN